MGEIWEWLKEGIGKFGVFQAMSFGIICFSYFCSYLRSWGVKYMIYVGGTKDK